MFIHTTMLVHFKIKPNMLRSSSDDKMQKSVFKPENDVIWIPAVSHPTLAPMRPDH